MPSRMGCCLFRRATRFDLGSGGISNNLIPTYFSIEPALPGDRIPPQLSQPFVHFSNVPICPKYPFNLNPPYPSSLHQGSHELIQMPAIIEPRGNFGNNSPIPTPIPPTSIPVTNSPNIIHHREPRSSKRPSASSSSGRARGSVEEGQEMAANQGHSHPFRRPATIRFETMTGNPGVRGRDSVPS